MRSFINTDKNARSKLFIKNGIHTVLFPRWLSSTLVQPTSVTNWLSLSCQSIRCHWPSLFFHKTAKISFSFFVGTSKTVFCKTDFVCFEITYFVNYIYGWTRTSNKHLIGLRSTSQACKIICRPHILFDRMLYQTWCITSLKTTNGNF